MQDPKRIWEFGSWIARRDPGTVRLSWADGEVVLGMRRGRIHNIEGLDPGELAEHLGCEGTGESDLLAESKALSTLRGIPETRTMGAAKEVLQRALHQWLMDPGRQFAIDDEEPAEVDGATISITHAMVELVLADTEHNVALTILPDSGVSLQRSSGFLELYAPLRLSEEADLIVASITGAATAADIARDSSHQPNEVVRLVAALVATGVLDASEPMISSNDLDWPDAESTDDETSRRKIPVWMIGAAAAALVIIIAIVFFVFLRGDEGDDSVAVGSGDWGVVVEMGCEPQDLQRMLRKRNLERKALRTIKADPTNGDTCFRLVWGSYGTQVAAEEALGEVPSNLIEEGFQPHVIEVSETETGSEFEVEG